MRLILLLSVLTSCANAGGMGSSKTRLHLRYSVAEVKREGRGTVATAWAYDRDRMVTAAHVCDNPAFTIDSRKPAKILVLRAFDLCMFEMTTHGYMPMRLAENEVAFGDRVYVYGHPLGYAHMLTEGFASEYERVDMGDYTGSRRRISAPAYGGNSGGPVLNEDGDVVGVLVAGVRAYPHVSLMSYVSQIKITVALWNTKH